MAALAAQIFVKHKFMNTYIKEQNTIVATLEQNIENEMRESGEIEGGGWLQPLRLFENCENYLFRIIYFWLYSWLLRFCIEILTAKKMIFVTKFAKSTVQNLQSKLYKICKVNYTQKMPVTQGVYTKISLIT